MRVFSLKFCLRLKYLLILLFLIMTPYRVRMCRRIRVLPLQERLRDVLQNKSGMNVRKNRDVPNQVLLIFLGEQEKRSLLQKTLFAKQICHQLEFLEYIS